MPTEENPLKAVPDYSDEDLTEAFAPIMQAAVRRAVYESDSGKIDAFIDLMLPLGFVEVSRTGVAAITRGAEAM